ncbi:MAG: hypothetical protein ACFFD9_00270 [Candidatus Thorarchaeota archaeon]
MRRKKTTVLLVLTLTFSFLLPLATVSFTKAAVAELPDYIGVDLESGLAGDVFMPEVSDSGYFAQESRESASMLPVGTTVSDWYVGAVTGNPNLTLRAITEYAEVWVADELSWPEGDPRNANPYTTWITDEMCEYLADQVSTVVWPRCTDFFGEPYDRDGTGTIFEAAGFDPAYYEWLETDQPQRILVKVLNIVDENYVDPTYPYYVIGFYSQLYTQTYYKRNMIQIDAYNWWERVGPEGEQWFPDTAPDLVVPANHQFAIDGTIAHEYQHLIHRDYHSSPAAFMNEGCSMFAEILCDYGISWGHINSFLATPDNSLTEWEDHGGINVLADYGQAALWTIYLSDHYDTEEEKFLSYYVEQGVPGIEGINQALDYFGADEDFNGVFHNWRLANLIHSDWPGDGKYNYKSIDLGSEAAVPLGIHEIRHLPVPSTRGTDFGTTITILGYDTGVSGLGSYGTDYIALTYWQKKKPWINKLLSFDGDANAIYGWRETDLGWYSGATSLMDTLLFASVESVPAEAELEITTYWDIEDYWDFGFIQVSTDGGSTWTSLENEYTTYDYAPGAHPDIVANLPGLTSWSMFIDEDGWITMSFDLSAYAGEDVLIGFRYMTDWASLFEGWYISEASVNGVPLENFQVTPSFEADYMVSLVYYGVWRGHAFPLWVSELSLDGDDAGEQVMPSFLQKPHFVIVVVSAMMGGGVADYSFGVSYEHKHGWPCFPR